MSIAGTDVECSAAFETADHPLNVRTAANLALTLTICFERTRLIPIALGRTSEDQLSFVMDIV